MISLKYSLCIFSLWSTLLCILAGQPEIDFCEKVQPYDTYYMNCATPVTCNENSKYRTINGSCNNLKNPLWGSTGTPYLRLAPANYADGDHQIRLQSNGMELPGPRELQLALFISKAFDIPDTKNFHLNQVGQWITHDISLMPTDLSGPTDCCAIQNTNNIPPQCQAVIKIAENDPVYHKMNKTCLPFRRVMTSTLNFNCKITPQIPVNQASTFIDVSQVYGHNADKAASLRSNVSGKLKTEIINEQEFGVQRARNGSLFCDGRNNVSVCFDGGDPRHNQHFGLILYQEMFLRFHNYVVDLLQKINQKWTDEVLYQEARKFVGGINQIVIYRDYLPILLGRQYAENVGLTLSKEKRTVYNPSLMPQLAVEFSGGGFRVPHNNVPSIFYFLDKNDQVVDKFKLNEHMSNPDPVVVGSNFENILRGMSKVPGRMPISSYNFLISNVMFHSWISAVADQDLLSIDIQRGRDIGLPSYVKVRELCGFPKISYFEDLIGVLSLFDISLLKNHYASVNDVDLIVGALLEPLAPDAKVGPTARCIIADGFYRLRYGDRFFCDVQSQPGSFTQEQYDVLWNLDLTKIFCASSRIDKLPCDIFTPSTSSVEMCECAPLKLNLEAWTDISDENQVVNNT